MASLTQVLYGNRLYGRVTYEENYDPQTLTATLADSQSSLDADIANTTKPLSDTQASSELIAKLIQRILTDSQSSSDVRIVELLKALAEIQGSSDAIALGTLKGLFDSLAASDAVGKTATKVRTEITASSPNLFGAKLFGVHTYSSDMIDPAIYMLEEIRKAVSKIFSEALAVADGSVAIQQSKGFLDFLIVQEWVNIKLNRANVWTATAGNAVAPVVLSLFGKPLYASALYTGDPTVSWAKPGTDTSVWVHNTNEKTSIPTLFGSSLFGRSLFSDVPVVMWENLPSSTRDWTNFDGENNQEA